MSKTPAMPFNPPKILSGIAVRDAKLSKLIERFKAIKPTPELAIIQVGNKSDSTAYIKAKLAFAKKVGVIARHIHLIDGSEQGNNGSQISQDAIIQIQEIKKCNVNPAIKGIVVQLPLPEYIDKEAVLNTVNPVKDIDGLTTTNVQRLLDNDPQAIIPATARGVKELLSYYKIDLAGKRVTVVGRSALVGRPIAQLCTNAGAIVTVAHSKTLDLVKETSSADVIIVAVGKKNLIKAEHVRAGQVIIDVGINRDGLAEGAKLVGDVDFSAVSKVIGSNGAISPVPGGVGPMTVLCLFENLADACAS